MDPQVHYRCEEILKSKKSELMMCVEFDLSQLPLPHYLSDPHFVCSEDPTFPHELSPRVINQPMVDTTFHYYLNGECHGYRVFQQDLHFQLQGKKIVKSVQDRILEYKQLVESKILDKVKELTHCN